MYLDAWRKHQAREAMQPLEQLIAEIVSLHPEYHALLENDEQALARDFLPELGESNPFMHMGMHIAIREQLATDRPAGIVAAHRQLLLHLQDAHAAEHQIMECLGQSLWEAQRAGGLPNEGSYLHCVQQCVRKRV
jgi:hypothetical protein